MIDFVYFVALAWGVTYGIVGSGLFAPARVYFAAGGIWVESLIYCPLCTGFWVALALRGIETHDIVDSLARALEYVGVTALALAAFPQFLGFGAYDRERELVQQIRLRERGGSGSGGSGSAGGDRRGAREESDHPGRSAGGVVDSYSDTVSRGSTEGEH